MEYREEKRDLFSVSDEYCLVQCISADLAMGKGIALEFNKRFDMQNKLKKRYPSGVLDCDLCYETIACIREGNVFNLVTKRTGREKPDYYSIGGAIYFLAEQCRIDRVKKLAMPLIGCGLDELEWFRVKDIIFNYFRNMDIEILVCLK